MIIHSFKRKERNRETFRSKIPKFTFETHAKTEKSWFLYHSGASRIFINFLQISYGFKGVVACGYV